MGCIIGILTHEIKVITHLIVISNSSGDNGDGGFNWLSPMCHSKVFLSYGLPNCESMVVHSGQKIQYSREARQGRVTMEDTML